MPGVWCVALGLELRWQWKSRGPRDKEREFEERTIGLRQREQEEGLEQEGGCSNSRFLWAGLLKVEGGRRGAEHVL